MAVLDLPDGRQLGDRVMGDPAGPAVLVLHGTPGSARQLASLAGPARDCGRHRARGRAGIQLQRPRGRLYRRLRELPVLATVRPPPRHP